MSQPRDEAISTMRAASASLIPFLLKATGDQGFHDADIPASWSGCLAPGAAELAEALKPGYACYIADANATEDNWRRFDQDSYAGTGTGFNTFIESMRNKAEVFAGPEDFAAEMAEVETIYDTLLVVYDDLTGRSRRRCMGNFTRLIANSIVVANHIDMVATFMEKNFFDYHTFMVKEPLEVSVKAVERMLAYENI